MIIPPAPITRLATLASAATFAGSYDSERVDESSWFADHMNDRVTNFIKSEATISDPEKVIEDAYDAGWAEEGSADMPARYVDTGENAELWAKYWIEGYNEGKCLEAEHRGELASNMYDL
jgi:hypothetical protein